MNEPVYPTPTPEQKRPNLLDGKGETTAPFIIYVLYLLGYFGWIPMVAGVVIAYMSKDSSPGWVAEHYRFQIRTFWISIVYICSAVFMIFTVILMLPGVLLSTLTVVWMIVRAVRGLVALQRQEPPSNVSTWLY